MRQSPQRDALSVHDAAEGVKKDSIWINTCHFANGSSESTTRFKVQHIRVRILLPPVIHFQTVDIYIRWPPLSKVQHTPVRILPLNFQMVDLNIRSLRLSGLPAGNWGMDSARIGIAKSGATFIYVLFCVQPFHKRFCQFDFVL